MSDVIVPKLFAYRHKKLNTLNNIGALSVLFDLHARNFMYMRISLRACCVQFCHRACNLSSPILRPYSDGYFSYSDPRL